MARGKRVEIVKLTVDGVEVDAKECTKCKKEKGLTEYSFRNKKTGKRQAVCRQCHREVATTHYLNNKEKYHKYYLGNKSRILAKQKEHYCANKDAYREWHREWCRKNRDHRREYNHRYYESNKSTFAVKHRHWAKSNREVLAKIRQRRRARRIGLLEMTVSVKRMCSLTGLSTSVHLDHWIPLETGHAGTYTANIAPLYRRINLSKKDKNPFEWFEANRQRFELDQSRFDALVGKLAAQNGLTPQEFRDFTYWCFDNPRTVEQIAEDNARYGYKKPSIEIWREEVGLPFPIAVDFGDMSFNNDISRKEDAA